jgi:hypothetical protein
MPATNARRLDNLQNPRGKNDQLSLRCCDSEFVSHKRIMTTPDRKSESVLISRFLVRKSSTDEMRVCRY